MQVGVLGPLNPGDPSVVRVAVDQDLGLTVGVEEAARDAGNVAEDQLLLGVLSRVLPGPQQEVDIGHVGRGNAGLQFAEKNTGQLILRNKNIFEEFDYETKKQSIALESQNLGISEFCV